MKRKIIAAPKVKAHNPDPETFRRTQSYRDVITIVSHEIWTRPLSGPPVTSYRPDQELHPQ